MKILHLVASPYWTGPLENIALLAQAQREAGHDVSVAIDQKRHHAPSEELAAPKLEQLGLLAKSQELQGLELSVKSAPWVMLGDIRRMRNVRADIVHAHMSHDHFLARWGIPKGTVLVRSVHALRSIRASLPYAHGYTVPFIAGTDLLLRTPVAVFPAIHAEEFQPATDRQTLRQELGLKEGVPLIGMVSSFQESRRHKLAFEALRKLKSVRPQVALVLAGDGALEAELKTAAAQQGVADRVQFLGYRSGEAFVKVLQALDEVWILGLGNDWSARAAVQARACDVRVVGVREGALVEWADALCDPVGDSVVKAAVSSNRISRRLPKAQAIAEELFDLYRRAGEEARHGRA